MTEPTHYSEISTFLRCERQWWFQYYLGYKYIEENEDSPSLYGTLGHVAIMNLLTQTDVNLVMDAMVHRSPGLDPNFYADVLKVSIRATANLMAHFGPQFKVVAIEEGVQIEEDGLIIQGTPDLVASDGHSLWVVDHKFRKTFAPAWSENYNLQMAMYQYMLARNGKDTVGSLQNQIFPGMPAIPKLNKPKKKDSPPEMSRADIKTDWLTYSAALNAAGLDPANYRDMQEKLSTKRFFDLSAKAYRNDEEVNRTWDNTVVPTIGRMKEYRENGLVGTPCMQYMSCVNCAFRNPCTELQKGGDWEMILRAQFHKDGEEPESYEFVDDGPMQPEGEVEC